ncbi:MAG: molybdopterin molybdenumtransferase MoeA [Candidatus Lokiarchaeota archaeon]|nr:molybdopterin molybdenumtransferase MoeA [Candidatus Lokiarchaeota archaeon]
MIRMADKKYYQALDINEVRKLLDQNFNFKPRNEYTKILKANGRKLAEDVIAPINVPHFDRSMRDGFAVMAKDTYAANEENPVVLDVIGNLLAGELPEKEIKDNQCIQIATGAPIPEGADAIVMVEYTNMKSENQVEIFKSTVPGQYIIKKGNDIKKDTTIINKNETLNSRDIGALAAIGKKRVLVYKLPKIHLYSTGNEIISLDEELVPGKVYDINSHTLLISIKNTGALVDFKGILPDNIEIAKNSLKESIKESDLIILSGGTSKGIGDIFPSIIKEMGDIRLLIHGLRVKPGKPTLFATLQVENELKFVVMLPGYPTSALTIFNVFLSKRLMNWSNTPIKEQKIIRAKLNERVYSEVGRREFKTVLIKEEENEKYAIPTKTGSDAITTLMGMDGYFEIHEQTRFLDEGEEILVTLFD